MPILMPLMYVVGGAMGWRVLFYFITMVCIGLCGCVKPHIANMMSANLNSVSVIFFPLNEKLSQSILRMITWDIMLD